MLEPNSTVNAPMRIYRSWDLSANTVDGCDGICWFGPRVDEYETDVRYPQPNELNPGKHLR